MSGEPIVRTWCDPSSRLDTSRAVEALARCGVSTYASGDLSAAAPTLVFYSDLGEELCRTVHSLSRGGQDRLMAIRLGDTEAQRDDEAWALLRHGASDALVWTGDSVVERVASQLRRWAEVEQVLSSSLVSDNLVGGSARWRGTLRQLIEAARYGTASTLITGETGTGKELAAKLIHTLDPKPGKGELVVLDCATVVESLSGSELFGHERGAFTGADDQRDGVFALADGGKLFLDEIGELPIALQAQLLRAIQEGAYKPVGSNRWRRANFRLICATNRDLEVEVERGGFRSDLYHRIASWRVRLPPLRERRADILPLFRHFAGKCDALAPLDAAVVRYLEARDYAGNVRELRRLAEQICHRWPGGGPISVGCVPPEERPEPGRGDPSRTEVDRAAERAVLRGLSLKEIRGLVEDASIHAAMELTRDNVSRAAERLGMTSRALQMRLANRRATPPRSAPAASQSTESADGG